MSRNIGQQPMATRFEHLLKVIASQRFLTMQGNKSDLPFFICDYKPAEAVEMTRLQKQLVNRLDQAGVRVLEVNLYDLSIDMIKARGLWDRILEAEPTVTKDELKEMLQNILDPEAHLVPEIGRRIEAAEYAVLFLSGVGEVFPYIRSHNVLNNLQKIAKEKPTVMFFPGEYTHTLESGAALVLFNRMQDDKYYRAYNIYDSQV